MNWKNIKESSPNDGERVLVWDECWQDGRILTYNEDYQCWDTDDGDDFEMSLDEPQPQHPDKCRVIWWARIEKPNTK